MAAIPILGEIASALAETIPTVEELHAYHASVATEEALYEEEYKARALKTIVNALKNPYDHYYELIPPPTSTSFPIAANTNWNVIASHRLVRCTITNDSRFCGWLKEFEKMFSEKGYRTELLGINYGDDKILIIHYPTPSS